MKQLRQFFAFLYRLLIVDRSAMGVLFYVYSFQYKNFNIWIMQKYQITTIIRFTPKPYPFT